VSGSGIRWAICKSAPRSRQITTPAPRHSVFTGRMPFLLPNQQRQSTEGSVIVINIMFIHSRCPVGQLLTLCCGAVVIPAIHTKPGGESRVPTDLWSGCGFSRSMPDADLRLRMSHGAFRGYKRHVDSIPFEVRGRMIKK